MSSSVEGLNDTPRVDFTLLTLVRSTTAQVRKKRERAEGEGPKWHAVVRGFAGPQSRLMRANKTQIFYTCAVVSFIAV